MIKDILRDATDFIEGDFGAPIDPSQMNKDTLTNDLLNRRHGNWGVYSIS